MKNLMFLVSLLCPSLILGKALESVSYELPRADESQEILPTEIDILQAGEREINEVTDFGNRLHQPLVSLIERRKSSEGGTVLVQDEDEIEVELQNARSPWIFLKLGAEPVFYEPLFVPSSSYRKGIKIKNGETTIVLPVSSIGFDQDDGDWEQIEYRLFIAMDQIPRVTQNAIRTSHRGSIESYLAQFARHDRSFGANEAPQTGLRQVSGNLQEGYVFYSCIRFENRSRTRRPEKEEDCHLYSLDQRAGVLGVIPGNNLAKYGNNKDFLYLVERVRKLRNERESEAKSWTKIQVPSKKYVSLENANWQDY